jgi:hypothetical protein
LFGLVWLVGWLADWLADWFVGYFQGFILLITTLQIKFIQMYST